MIEAGDALADAEEALADGASTDSTSGEAELQAEVDRLAAEVARLEAETERLATDVTATSAVAPATTAAPDTTIAPTTAPSTTAAPTTTAAPATTAPTTTAAPVGPIEAPSPGEIGDWLSGLYRSSVLGDGQKDCLGQTVLDALGGDRLSVLLSATAEPGEEDDLIEALRDAAASCGIDPSAVFG